MAHKSEIHTINDNCKIVYIEKLCVRVVYKDMNDAGHLIGPFNTRDQAERCLLVVAGRMDVKSAKIEPSTTNQ